MFDFFFFVKTVLMAVVLAAFLQIRVGEHTLEQKATTMIQSSGVIAPLQMVADGGVKVLRDSVNWAATQINSRFEGKWPWSKEPTNRRTSLKLERSEKSGHSN